MNLVEFLWRVNTKLKHKGIDSQSFPAKNDGNFVFTGKRLNEIFSRLDDSKKSKWQKESSQLDFDTLMRILGPDLKVSEEKEPLAYSFRNSINRTSLSEDEKVSLLKLIVRLEQQGILEASVGKKCRSLFIGGFGDDDLPVRLCVAAANKSIVREKQQEAPLVSTFKQNVTKISEMAMQTEESSQKLIEKLKSISNTVGVDVIDLEKRLERLLDTVSKCHSKVREMSTQATAISELNSEARKKQQLLSLKKRLGEAETLFQDKQLAVEIAQRELIERQTTHNKNQTRINNERLATQRRRLEEEKSKTLEKQQELSKQTTRLMELESLLDKKLSHLEEENVEKNETLNKNLEERDKLQQKLALLVQESEKLLRFREKCGENGRTLAQELGEQMATQFESTHRKTADNLQNTESMLQNLDENMKSLQNTQQKLYNTICETRDLKLECSQKLATVRQSFATSQQRIENLTQTVSQLQNRARELEQTKKELQKNYEELKVQVEKANSKVQIKNRELKQKETQTKLLENELQETAVRQQENDRKHQMMVKASQIKLEKLQKQFQELNTRHDVQVEKTQQTQKIAEMNDKKAKKLGSELEETRNQLQTEIEDANARDREIKKLLERTQTLETAANQLEGENKILEEELNESRREAAQCAEIGKVLLSKLTLDDK